MAKLTTKKRAALPAKDFGLPKDRAYPMPDRSHAVDAKGRATQQEKRGGITAGQEKKIDAKANAILRRGK
jgi:hypothetical protein